MAPTGPTGPTGQVPSCTRAPRWATLGHMTAKPPTWAILVPTLGERRQLFERLMGTLLPQTDAYRDRVRVIGRFNNGTPSLAAIRQALVVGAGTDYVSFVDDDDLVSGDYVSSVMGALGARPDYVGFQVQCYSDGRPTGIADHSLKHRGWTNEPRRYFRDISHINPIRASIAATADFRRARIGAAEDRAWVEQLRRGGKLKTEIYLPKIVYHYLYSTSRKPGEGSRWRDPVRTIDRTVTKRSAIEHPNFSWSDDA